MGEWESGRVGEWESGRVGEWESGRVGEWEYSESLSLSPLTPSSPQPALAAVLRDGVLKKCILPWKIPTRIAKFHDADSVPVWDCVSDSLSAGDGESHDGQPGPPAGGIQRRLFAAELVRQIA